MAPELRLRPEGYETRSFALVYEKKIFLTPVFFLGFVVGMRCGVGIVVLSAIRKRAEL